MILTCPECAMRYLVPDTAVPPNGRQVRCANCRHSWHQAAADPLDAAPPAALSPPPPVPSSLKREPVSERSNRPLPGAPAARPVADVMDHRPPFKPRRNPLRTWSWIAGGLAVVLLAIAALALTVGREPLARLAGVPTQDPNPLVFVDDIVESGTFGANRPMLIVSAKVLNTGAEPRAIPPIVADGVDANGRVIYSWTIPAPQPRVQPGERVAFSSGQSGASDKIRRVELSFDTPDP